MKQSNFFWYRYSSFLLLLLSSSVSFAHFFLLFKVKYGRRFRMPPLRAGLLSIPYGQDFNSKRLKVRYKISLHLACDLRLKSSRDKSSPPYLSLSDSTWIRSKATLQTYGHISVSDWLLISWKAAAPCVASDSSLDTQYRGLIKGYCNFNLTDSHHSVLFKLYPPLRTNHCRSNLLHCLLPQPLQHCHDQNTTHYHSHLHLRA